MNYRLLLYFSVALVFYNCTTKKNTVVTRAYHNLTARFNGYYYSTESIKDGVYKLERNNKENYEKILPVYIYPSNEKAKATFPEFDKAIKKSTLCIQRHAIKDKKGDEIPTAGKWIDNNWINIGISRVYKREFFSGIESFEYVARTYNQSKDKYEAMFWLARAYNEIGSVSNSEPIISLLKNEKKLPIKIKKELPALEADYYFRKGLYTEASTKLMEACRNKNLFTGVSKKNRARYSFIIAQLLEEQKDTKRAKQYYEKTISLKPDYEMVFYSKIKLARMLDVKRVNSEKTKKDLLKMSKEFKNSDYYDVIYFTLGEIEEKEKNTDKAIYYYKRSVQTSVINPSQKAFSYLKLGEINFDLTNYQLAEAYYDSTLVTLPKDHNNYKNIVARQKTLQTLVGYIKTIKNEDSIQRVSKMSEKDRDALIERLIRKIEADEEKAKTEKDKVLGDNLLNNNLVNPSSGAADINVQANASTSFYFYNQNTISFGISDFAKKWGNRKNEDNWRRSNKAMTIDENFGNSTDPNKGGTVKSNKDPKKTKEYYIKNLYTADSSFKSSNHRIIEAYYLLGTTYKEDLSNNKKAIASFEELNSRYTKHKYLLNTYYQMYRMYEQDKKQDKADYYKEKILNEYPNSEFAQLIKNPKYAEEKQAETSEVEKEYTKVYSVYIQNNYQEALNQSNAAISKFGKNNYQPKFEFIRAMCIGKLKGIDSLEASLKQLVAVYPKSEVTPLANDILQSIKKQKNPEMFSQPNKPNLTLNKDTFQINLESEHFIIAVCPDDPKIANSFKTNLDAFAKKYYSAKQFNINSNLFGKNQQLVIFKSFPNASEANSFFNNFINDSETFKGEVKKELFEVFLISSQNLPMFYKKQNVTGYKLFWLDNYKSLQNSGNQPGNK